MPLISVIVPVYKVEPYLHRCIDSILAQSFTDFELILVDDGSPDNCGAICDEYAEKDKRIHVIHQENGGLSAARNAGIDWAFRNSDSEWIAFVDSDDWLHTQLFELLLDAATKHNTNISVCGFERTFGEIPNISEYSLASKLWSPEEFFVDRNVNAVVVWGKIFRKRCLQNIRFPEGKIHEDEFATYKILFAEKQIAFIDAPLYFYFQNDTGIMRSPWSEKRLAAFDIKKEQIDFFHKNGFLHAEHKVQESTLWSYKGTIDKLVESRYDKKIICMLRCELRKAIKQYKKELEITIKSMPGIYESAYPHFMQIYWLTLALYNKLFKRK